MCKQCIKKKNKLKCLNMTGNYNNNTKTYRKLTLKHKKVKILFVYPRNTKEFTRTPSEMSVHSRSNWNLEMLVFEERGKPEYLEKNLSEQSREPSTTYSTHIWHRATLVGGKRSHHCTNPAPHKCSQKDSKSYVHVSAVYLGWDFPSRYEQPIWATTGND